MKKEKFKVLYALGFAWQLGFLVVINIAFFAFIGHYLDKLFHTENLFLLIGFIISPVFSIFQIYSGLIPLVKKEDKNHKK